MKKLLLSSLFPLFATMACVAPPAETGDDGVATNAPATEDPAESPDDRGADPANGASRDVAPPAASQLDDSDHDAVLASEAERAAIESSQPQAYKCGVNLITSCSGSNRYPNCRVDVHYRNCASYTRRVKARIALWPDSGCFSVGAGSTRWMTSYNPLIAHFQEIVRC